MVCHCYWWWRNIVFASVVLVTGLQVVVNWTPIDGFVLPLRTNDHHRTTTTTRNTQGVFYYHGFCTPQKHSLHQASKQASEQQSLSEEETHYNTALQGFENDLQEWSDQVLSDEGDVMNNNILDDDNDDDYVIDKATVVEPVIDHSLEDTVSMLLHHQNQSLLHNNDNVLSDVAYFFLKDEVGLSEEEMWKITFQAGQILGLKVSVIRTKVDFLQQTMNLARNEVRDLISQQPTILALSVEHNMKPTIEFLCKELNIHPEMDLKRLILSSPAILCYSLTNLAAKLNFFSTTLGLSQAERLTLLLADSRLLCCGLESGLLPHVKFWTKEMRFPLDSFRKMVLKNPRMLTYSLNDNLRPKVIFYLIMTLHMDPRQVLKVLRLSPEFLNYSLEEHMLPITRYFLSELGYSAMEFRNILLKYPRIMLNALYKIKHVVGYFRYELGLEASQVKRVLYQAPQLAALSNHNVQSKIDYIRATFALNDDELRQVLAAVPRLLVCNVKLNLQPKIDYLLDVFQNNSDDDDFVFANNDDNYFDMQQNMERNLQQQKQRQQQDDGVARLRQAFLKFPTLLVYSLDRRIRPRLEQIVKAGISPSKITVGIPMKEDHFVTWLQRHIDRRQRKRLSGWQQDTTTVVPDEFISTGRITHWTRQRRME